MDINQANPLRIGIIGAGFSGTALAANLSQYANIPIEIILFEKRGCFAQGEAYSTPYSYHLLNVRAHDMSLFDDAPTHFVDWLQSHAAHPLPYLDGASLDDQFVSRQLYGRYLSEVLQQIHTECSDRVTLIMEHAEVRDAIPDGKRMLLVTDDNRIFSVDKVVLTTGNHAPAHFPFPVSSDTQCILNPWDFQAAANIPRQDAVCIVGTGLSMIDTVLTLYHQQHEGQIYALSRHGLLPLPHADTHLPSVLLPAHLPTHLRSLTQHIRSLIKTHQQADGDWRSVMNAIRAQIPSLWENMNWSDKNRFIRHVLPYWNIHRHRVPARVAAILEKLMADKQLHVMAGRIQSVENEQADIVLRHTKEKRQVQIQWLVNCMGPAMNMSSTSNSLVQGLITRKLAMLDPLKLGFVTGSSGALMDTAGNLSSQIFTIGPPAKGMMWECSAVPEIRRLSVETAKNILNRATQQTQVA